MVHLLGCWKDSPSGIPPSCEPIVLEFCSQSKSFVLRTVACSSSRTCLPDDRGRGAWTLERLELSAGQDGTTGKDRCDMRTGTWSRAWVIGAVLQGAGAVHAQGS